MSYFPCRCDVPFLSPQRGGRGERPAHTGAQLTALVVTRTAVSERQGTGSARAGHTAGHTAGQQCVQRCPAVSSSVVRTDTVDTIRAYVVRCERPTHGQRDTPRVPDCSLEYMRMYRAPTQIEVVTALRKRVVSARPSW